MLTLEKSEKGRLGKRPITRRESGGGKGQNQRPMSERGISMSRILAFYQSEYTVHRSQLSQPIFIMYLDSRFTEGQTSFSAYSENSDHYFGIECVPFSLLLIFPG